MWLLIFAKEPELQPAHSPPCAACGRVTKVVTTIPATRERAATHVFECTVCGLIDLMRDERHSPAEAETLNGSAGSM
jgi:transcription elongation factor Elf1